MQFNFAPVSVETQRTSCLILSLIIFKSRATIRKTQRPSEVPIMSLTREDLDDSDQNLQKAEYRKSTPANMVISMHAAIIDSNVTDAAFLNTL